MTRKEFVEILKNYPSYYQRFNAGTEFVDFSSSFGVYKYSDMQWCFYETDERCLTNLRFFPNESEAYQYVLSFYNIIDDSKQGETVPSPIKTVTGIRSDIIDARNKMKQFQLQERKMFPQYYRPPRYHRSIQARGSIIKSNPARMDGNKHYESERKQYLQYLLRLQKANKQFQYELWSGKKTPECFVSKLNSSIEQRNQSKVNEEWIIIPGFCHSKAMTGKRELNKKHTAQMALKRKILNSINKRHPRSENPFGKRELLCLRTSGGKKKKK